MNYDSDFLLKEIQKIDDGGTYLDDLLVLNNKNIKFDDVRTSDLKSEYWRECFSKIDLDKNPEVKRYNDLLENYSAIIYFDHIAKEQHGKVQIQTEIDKNIELNAKIGKLGNEFKFNFREHGLSLSLPADDRFENYDELHVKYIMNKFGDVTYYANMHFKKFFFIEKIGKFMGTGKVCKESILQNILFHENPEMLRFVELNVRYKDQIKRKIQIGVEIKDILKRSELESKLSSLFRN